MERAPSCYLFAPLVFEKSIEPMFRGKATLLYDALFDVAVLNGTTIVDPTETPSPNQIVFAAKSGEFFLK